HPARLDQPRGLRGVPRPLLLGRLLRAPGPEGRGRHGPGGRRRDAYRQARGPARRVPRGALRLDPPDHRAARDRLPPGLGRARRLRPDVDQRRARARGRDRKPAGARADAHVRPLLGGVRGAKQRALELLDALLADQRPQAWNQWSEILWRDREAPRFIGDMPHTWVGATFVRAVRMMLAYERESDQALVLAAGVPAAWATAEQGISVKRLP